MSKKPTTMKAYVKSNQDKKEDAANAKIAGMKTSAFKKTKQAKTIDKEIVSLNKRKK